MNGQKRQRITKYKHEIKFNEKRGIKGNQTSLTMSRKLHITDRFDNLK